MLQLAGRGRSGASSSRAACTRRFAVRSTEVRNRDPERRSAAPATSRLDLERMVSSLAFLARTNALSPAISGPKGRIPPLAFFAF